MRTLLLTLLLVALPAVAAGSRSAHAQARAATSPTLAEAAPSPAVIAMRLEQPVVFDGVVTGEEWDAVDPLQLVTHWPSFGEPPSQPTELRLAYDDDYLYFSARCFDADPPTGTSYGRDRWDDANDQVALTLDTFGDHENAVVFVLYATGARIDASISDDARSGSSVSTDWNTFWDGAVSRDAEGWYGEMRIPWSSLRFQPDADGRVTMGVLAYRHIARLREMQLFPAVPAEWGFWSFAKPSKAQPVRFDGLRASRPLHVTPYATGGLGQEHRLRDDGAAYDRTDHPAYDVGFDLKYGLTSNLTLDATVNTDFAQVEADDQQVNLTRFSLFFPEKRQFFLERTSTFDFGFGGNDRVFYSRRVGLAGGRQVPLLGGLRLVGRSGGWDVGAMTMQSGRAHGLSSENVGVVRLKRQVLRAGSYVGGIATSRLDAEGGHNVVYGLDGVLNVRGDDLIRWNWAQSVDADRSAALLASSRLRLLWERARSEGLVYAVGFSRSGRAYDPALGFQLRHDYTEVTGNVGVGWLPEAPSPLEQHWLALQNAAFFRNEDGAVETIETTATYDATWRRGFRLTARAGFAYEHLLDGFALSDDAEVPAGRYRMGSGRVWVQMPGAYRFRPAVTIEGGSFFDGRRASLLFSPTWSLSAQAQLSGAYGYDRVRFTNRDQRFDAHIGRARVDLTVSTRVSFTAFVQANSATDAVVANVRFRYNPREGRDLYLVYNEVFNADRARLQPTLPLTDSRALIVKFAHTFLW